MMMKKTLRVMILGLSTLSPCMAMEGGEQNTQHISCKMMFKDGSEIELSPNGTISVSNSGESLLFDDNDPKKEVFNATTGETVIEYSGLATDGNPDRSWAKAIFEPGASSPAHFHQERTEEYYIISEGAQALVIVDTIEHSLSKGDHLTILPTQRHQVLNRSEKAFSLMVKCTPSWIVEDFKICQ